MFRCAFSLLFIALFAVTGCTRDAPKTTTLSHSKRSAPKPRAQGVQIAVPWKKAAIDAGDHVVVTEIPSNWPSKPNMRYTKRDGKSIEFYPPGGGRTGDRVIINRIFTNLPPNDYARTDSQRLAIWCGAQHTRQKTMNYHEDGITALSLCGSSGGASAVSSSLNKEGEAILYRLAYAPGGLYRIAHYWTGKAFNVNGTLPVSHALLNYHKQALGRARFCSKKNPPAYCVPYMN